MTDQSWPGPMTVPESYWQDLAWWASQTPKPKPPELIPGLVLFNAYRMEDYRIQLVAWKIGKAEALLRGLTIPEGWIR